MSKVDILYVLGPFPTRGGLQMEVQVCKQVTNLAFLKAVLRAWFVVVVCLGIFVYLRIFFSCGSKKVNLATLKNVKIHG